MDNIVSLSSFVAKKEQQRKDEEKAEYDRLYQYVSEALSSNLEDNIPFFAYSSEDLNSSTIDIAVMKLMDAITLLDNLGKKKEAHIINRVVADLLGIEEE